MNTLEAPSREHLDSQDGEDENVLQPMEAVRTDPEVGAHLERVRNILQGLESNPGDAEVYVRMYDEIERSPEEAVRTELFDTLAQKTFGVTLAERARVYADARRAKYAEQFGQAALDEQERTRYDASGSVAKRGLRELQPEDLEKARKELIETVSGDPRYSSDEKTLAEYFRLSDAFKEKAREVLPPSPLDQYIEATGRYKDF